jgi:hypothetical protein
MHCPYSVERSIELDGSGSINNKEGPASQYPSPDIRSEARRSGITVCIHYNK